MPRRSLSFQASPGGLPVPVGCLVPVCLALCGGRKVPAVVAGPRDEATATKDHLPWPPELPAPPNIIIIMVILNMNGLY